MHATLVLLVTVSVKAVFLAPTLTFWKPATPSFIRVGSQATGPVGVGLGLGAAVVGGDETVGVVDGEEGGGTALTTGSFGQTSQATPTTRASARTTTRPRRTQ